MTHGNIALMSGDIKKTLEQINAEVCRGSSVVAEVAPEQPEDAFRPAGEKVDAVTSATQRNTVYLQPMPVIMPTPLPKKVKKSE